MLAYQMLLPTDPLEPLWSLGVLTHFGQSFEKRVSSLNEVGVRNGFSF